MAEIQIPAVLEGKELVRSVRTPARMEFLYTAVVATT